MESRMGLQTSSDREGMTRSQLLAARRAESADQLQSSYDVWANKNPMWAPRATGPDAAAALGYGSGGEAAGPSTRRELMLERQMDNLRQSVAASGFDKDTQAALCANEPGVLVTSLVREAGQQNPSTAWVHNPKRATRTDLAKARADVDRGTIQHYQDRYEKYGHMDAQARSDFRVDRAAVRAGRAGVRVVNRAAVRAGRAGVRVGFLAPQLEDALGRVLARRDERDERLHAHARAVVAVEREHDVAREHAAGERRVGVDFVDAHLRARQERRDGPQENKLKGARARAQKRRDGEESGRAPSRPWR